jgi:hypothetical protein
VDFYTAFALTIRSDLPLPELLPGNGKADVTILSDRIGPSPEEEGPILCSRADDREVCLTWGRVGTVLVRGGCEMIVDPAPGVGPEPIRLLILGAAMGVLLYQRGLTVLHGSAVAIDGGVVAFLGVKGAGKSAIAAALYARGHRFITDDLLVVQYDQQGKPLVLAGYPQIKLWPDAVSMLGENPEDLPRIRPDVEKRAQTVVMPDPQMIFPLRKIFFLGVSDKTKIFPVPTQFIFSELIRELYVSHFEILSKQISVASTLFRQSVDLARRTSCSLLVRKNDLSALPEVAKLVEASLD